MSASSTVVVDMRNHYESEIGHFENANLPDADTFKQELPMVLDALKIIAKIKSCSIAPAASVAKKPAHFSNITVLQT